MSVSSPNLRRKVLGILTDTADTDYLLLLSSTIVVGEKKMSFETLFFPFWEQTKNVLRDTNEFNIDSLIGTKKMSSCCVSKLMSFTVGSYRRRELGERSTATVLRAL